MHARFRIVHGDRCKYELVPSGLCESFGRAVVGRLAATGFHVNRVTNDNGRLFRNVQWKKDDGRFREFLLLRIVRIFEDNAHAINDRCF